MLTVLVAVELGNLWVLKRMYLINKGLRADAIGSPYPFRLTNYNCLKKHEDYYCKMKVYKSHSGKINSSQDS